MLKKILGLIFLFTALISCDRKPLYLQGDCMINVNITTQAAVESYIDDYWKDGWRDSLIFDWGKTGKPLGYTFPDSVNFMIFDNGALRKERLKTNKRQLVDILLNRSYNFLIYNETPTINADYIGGRYYIETPKIGSKATVLDNNYETVEQPGEVFSTYVQNVYLSDDVSQYEEIYENDKLVYVYNIDAAIKPVSYIYIIQFIIVNDDHTVIEASDISDFTISGISIRKNLFNCNASYTGRKQIKTTTVEEGQFIADSLVFASRVTLLDILPKDDEASWDSYNSYLFYTGIDIETHTYGTVSGIIDITKQLNSNPKGGIITIRILNSEIKAAGGSGDGQIGIDVNEWYDHHIDIE